ncbi:MAG: bifunctional proline dehydrogenase/L-glutamate gamma-semialdehyde dehydrogenase, partial [bacterium]
MSNPDELSRDSPDERMSGSGNLPGPPVSAPSSWTIQKALALAKELQERAVELQTPQEKKQQAEFDRMMQNPLDKATLTQITDQAFRSNNPGRAASQLTHILDVQGVPRFFNRTERALLKGFQSFGSYLPGVAVPLVKEKMREETANVILPAESELLGKHLEARKNSGVRMNVNFLGEAILGEEEARSRLESYLQALQMPDIEVISIKISTIFSQISSLARDRSISALCERMELLFRAAAKMRFTRVDGTVVPKFVYLDMEEYRDMEFTSKAFMRTLGMRGLENVSAGIALQAYIPDSYEMQKRINEWARARVSSGGAPVTIRLVKGANMEIERVEASIQGWPQAPYKSKIEVDANYKRMIHEGLLPENIEAVRLGIASHNLFELSYALILAEECGAMDRVQFEMLEGMANHQRRALFERAKNLLLYAPAIRKENFINAISYLIRRLDENTGPDNFLRHAFRLSVDSREWERLQAGFLDSFKKMDNLSSKPRRTQDRNRPVDEPSPADDSLESFVNEPNTDFTLRNNVEWAEKILEKWKERAGAYAAEIPLVIAGKEIREDRTVRECFDPSRPGEVVGRYRRALAEDIRRAVQCARDDPDGWRRMPHRRRSEILGAVAMELRRRRGDLIGAAMSDGGKIIPESDPEVSEAIDFLEFYRRSAGEFYGLENLHAKGKGVVVVVSPWNFPLAIPCGGVAAALAAGNTVILKPASESVLAAFELCKCFWRAGVSKNVLQFAPCSGSDVGSKLVSHPGVDTVILTGGTETAIAMLKAKPDMDLLGETGGKNATIVTSLSDREQAIKHVLHSAFSHSGQKCSATSLLILEDEVYEDPQFRKSLCDAVESMDVGSAWELHTTVGPLIRPPGGELEISLKELEPGESWAVMPHMREDNPNLYGPAVKWGVQPGGFTHMTELFGPVLGVMRAKNLEEAIGLVNQTGYGLTSGLESLDDREQRIWRESIEAGNLYINRVTTGAIVLRQPFGGMGKSAFGPGIKAGGPNYVAQLMDFETTKTPPVSPEISDIHLRVFREELYESEISGHLPGEEVERIASAIGSYDLNVKNEFEKLHDHFLLVGEDN